MRNLNKRGLFSLIVIFTFSLFQCGCFPASIKSNKVQDDLIAVEGSLLYHRQGCPLLGARGYLPSEKTPRHFSSQEEAKKMGFLPCPRCMDDHQWDRRMTYEEGFPFLALFLFLFLIPCDSWYFGFSSHGFSGHIAK